MFAFDRPETVTPLGHLAVATLASRGAGYDATGLRLCLFGALLPDLIDKPLFALGIVRVSHTVGHSVVGLAVAAVVATRYRALAPVVVGWATHVAADLVVAYPVFVVNYAWPVLTGVKPPAMSRVAYWSRYATGPLFALELVAVALVVVTAPGGPRRWARDAFR
jgi:hypothetical protein